MLSIAPGCVINLQQAFDSVVGNVDSVQSVTHLPATALLLQPITWEGLHIDWRAQPVGGTPVPLPVTHVEVVHSATDSDGGGCRDLIRHRRGRGDGLFGDTL